MKIFAFIFLCVVLFLLLSVLDLMAKDYCEKTNGTYKLGTWVKQCYR